MKLLLLPLLATITLPLEGAEGLLVRGGAAAAATAAMWMGWGRPSVRWFRKIREEDIKRHQADLAWKARIEKELSINGSKHLLPPDEQGLSLAELVVQHHIRTAPLIKQFIEEHEKP